MNKAKESATVSSLLSSSRTKQEWVVYVGRDLAELCDSGRDGAFVTQAEALVRLSVEYGLPPVYADLRLDPILRANRYLVTLNGHSVGGGEIRPGFLLANGPPSVLAELPGEPALSTFPAAVGYGFRRGPHEKHLAAGDAVPRVRERWIAPEIRDLAERRGCRVRDARFDLAPQLYAAYHARFLWQGGELPETTRPRTEGIFLPVIGPGQLKPEDDGCGEVANVSRVRPVLSLKEPVLVLEPLTVELGAGWMDRWDQVFETLEQVREDFAWRLGLALPAVEITPNPLLPEDTMALSLNHEERWRARWGQDENPVGRLSAVVTDLLPDLLSSRALDRLVDEVSRLWSAASAIRECYTTEELRSLYLALARRGVPVRRQTEVFSELISRKSNSYDTVARLSVQPPSPRIPHPLEVSAAVWTLELGPGLEELADPQVKDGYASCIEYLRARYAADGLPQPEVRLSLSAELPAFTYRVLFRNRSLGWGQAQPASSQGPGWLLATGPQELLEGLPGQPALSGMANSIGWAMEGRRSDHAIFTGCLPARWLEPRHRHLYEAAGCRVRDPRHDLGPLLVALYGLFFGDVYDLCAVDHRLREADKGLPGVRERVLRWHSPCSLRRRALDFELRGTREGCPSAVFWLAFATNPQSGCSREAGFLESLYGRIEREQPSSAAGLRLRTLVLSSSKVADLEEVCRLEESEYRWSSLERTLVDTMLELSPEESGILLVLPSRLHARARRQCCFSLGSALRLEAPAVGSPAHIPANLTFFSPALTPLRYLRPVGPQLCAERVEVTFGRGWRKQHRLIQDILREICTDLGLARFGVGMTDFVARQCTWLAHDQVRVTVGHHELGRWRMPPLGVAIRDVVCDSQARGIPLLYTGLVIRLEETIGEGPGDWPSVLSALLDDAVLRGMSHLVSRARIADLLKDVAREWPWMWAEIRQRWSLGEIQRLYLQLFRWRLQVGDHRPIMECLGGRFRELVPTFDGLLERTRAVLSPALMAAHADNGVLHAVTLQEQACAKLRQGLSGNPARLAAWLQDALLGALANHAHEFHPRSILLVPPDLRRPLENFLAMVGPLPVLATTELTEDTELALEVSLSL